VSNGCKTILGCQNGCKYVSGVKWE